MTKVNYNDLMQGRHMIQVFVRHPRFPQHLVVERHGPYHKITKAEISRIKAFYEMKYDDAEVTTENVVIQRPFILDENAARIEGEWQREEKTC